MFRRKATKSHEANQNITATDAYIDSLFSHTMHFTGHQAVSSIVEIADQMEADGVDPLVIEILPDRNAYTLEQAAKRTDLPPAPPYRTNRNS